MPFFVVKPYCFVISFQKNKGFFLAEHELFPKSLNVSLCKTAVERNANYRVKIECSRYAVIN